MHAPLAEQCHGPIGLLTPPPIAVECEAFSGSFVMLLECVRKRRIDLLGVPLAPICETYLEYVVGGGASEEDLESAGVAMAALSYLVERKAWLLLPSSAPEPEDEQPPGLPNPTISEFGLLIEELRSRELTRSTWFFRSASAIVGYEMPVDVRELTVQSLAAALQSVLERAKPPELEPIARPSRSLADQMEIVMRRLGPGWVELDDLVGESFERVEIVWTFLAILELVRLGQVQVRFGSDTAEFSRGKRR